MTDYEYGDYTLSQCCTECGYANNHPDFEVRVCPKCGGDVEMTRGRWKYIEIKNPWLAVVLGMGYIERTEKHRGDFVKKSDEKPTSTHDEVLRGEKFAVISDEQIEKIKSTLPLSDEDIEPEEMYPQGYTWHKIINDTPFYDIPFHGQQVVAFTFNDDGERIKKNLYFMGKSEGDNLGWSANPFWKDSTGPHSYWVHPVTHWSGIPYSKQESFALSDEQIEKIKSTPPLSDEDRDWLGMRPVGKEFGSATFDDNAFKRFDGGWKVDFGKHAPKIHVHTSAGDPEDMHWQAAAILVLAGYKDATGFDVERGGDGRYYLIPNTLDPRGIKSYVTPFSYTEEGFQQFAAIERYIRDPKNGFGLWETAESCFTIPDNLMGIEDTDIVYRWRQEILAECLSVMADRYYD